MFNDKYGLTAAVLNETKTQIRRIISGVLPEIQELRVVNNLCEYKDPYTKKWNKANKRHQPKYNVGEVVAVAQSYFDIKTSANSYRPQVWKEYKDWHKYLDTLPNDTAGHYNKMMVKAELMPYKIEITNIKVERLQDITKKGCFAEGIEYDGMFYSFKGTNEGFLEAKEAYVALIDAINGKGTWENNPWVFVYDFKLIRK